jgi:DNA polymerase type B, organellar and viral
MIEPLNGAPRTHNFIVYDLEWWPGTYELRMIGVYDTRKGYRYYRTVKEFFAKELTGANTSRRFYAHFGGSSDVLFLLDYALNNSPDLQIDAIFAGSSAVILKIKKSQKKHWTFIDSGFLIRRPLKDIGNWIGLEKGNKDVIYSEDFAELRDYNERDCRILYEAIEKLQRQVNNLGGELRCTLASTALDIFRRQFLRRRIATSKELNAQARNAYIASRVEVFEKECPEGEYYDINSSFPSSMTHPQPADVKNRLKRLPNDDPYLADLTVSIPHIYLPPLPYRSCDGRLLFPTGSWRGLFDKADVELLLQTGGKIETLHEVTSFHSFTELGDYARTLYEYKNRATGYEKEVWKLLLNALYGKFGERSDKRQIVIRPDDTRCKHNPVCSSEYPCIELIAPNIYSIRIDKDVAHAHVPISVHITALSRSLLYNSLAKCRRVFYCDTDSIVCSRSDKLPTSTSLGALKHEYSVRDGQFLAPKLYTFAKPDGTRIVRAKGFSRLDYDGFCKLAEGKDHVITRMARIREGLGTDGTFAPRDVTIPKHVYLKNTKRRFLPSGQSEPWRVSELLAS